MATQANQQSKLILVTDGDKVSVKMTLSALKGFIGQHPYRVELAECAEEVYNVIRLELERFGQLPALILLDPELPGLQQPDFVRELRQEYPGIPKVLCTSKHNLSQALEQEDILFWLPHPWDGMYRADRLRDTLGI